MSTLSNLGAAHRLRSLAAIAILALAAMLLGASSARAAGAVGPVDASGIAVWYQDATGLQLAPCLLGPPSCFGTLADLNANGGEAFYSDATASLTDPGGASFTVVMAVEAANLNGLISFGRIRAVGKGLTPNTTYTVNEPYGDITLTSDAGGIAKDTTDIGCGAAPCAFAAALGSPLFGGFLQWDTTFGAPPLGFIGDNVTPHQVIGSPIARNSVTVTGGGLSLFTDKFVVQGELAAGATPPGMLPPAAPVTPRLLAVDDTGASSTDNVTKITTPTIVGDTVRGSNVTLKVDGVVNGTGTALADGAYAIKLPTALTDGTHTITATAANPLSGAASPASAAFTITIDATAPATPAAPKTAQPLSASVGAFFTGTAEAASSISLFADGDPIGNGVATGGSYSIKASALGTGVHHITATATDLAGNTSAPSAGLVLPVGSVSGILPPSLNAASDTGVSSTDGITNIAQPTFIGSLSLTNATVTLFADGQVIGTGTATGGAYSITSSTKLADGQHLITITVNDTASGLDSTPSAPLRITVDTVAPGAPSTPVASAPMVAGTLSVTGTADAGSAISVFVDDRKAATGAAAAGSWSATLAGLAGGSHSIAAAATDLAGNTSARSAALVVSPASAPAASPSSPPATVHVAKGPQLVAVGAVSRAVFKGRTATVAATVTVDKHVRLTLHAATPSGRSVTLLRGSRFGSTVQRAARSTSLHATHGAGRVRIELHLDRAQLKRHGLYRIVVGATDANGHTTTLRIAFRVA